MRRRMIKMRVLMAGLWLVGVSAVPALADSAQTPVAPENARLTVELSRPPVEESVALESHAAMRRGMGFLLASQLPDGSWGRHPALTGLAALALLNAPERLGTPESAAASERAACFLRRRLAADAGAPEPAADAENAGNLFLLNLAVGSWALVRLGHEEDRPLLRSVRARLLAAQCLDVPEKDPAYGGFRAGAKGAPDLMTAAYMLETLSLTDFLDRGDAAASARSAKARAAALRFVTGHVPPASAAGQAPAPGGLPVVAALKSLFYAGAGADDPRVKELLGRFGREAVFEANPGAGGAGYYTYLFTAVQSLHAGELRGIRLAAAAPRLSGWRSHALESLLARQGGDGAWRQAAPDWWETRPELATACALLAMELALRP